jgi:hypothetical protein
MGFLDSQMAMEDPIAMEDLMTMEDPIAMEDLMTMEDLIAMEDLMTAGIPGINFGAGAGAIVII